MKINLGKSLTSKLDLALYDGTYHSLKHRSIIDALDILSPNVKLYDRINNKLYVQTYHLAYR